MRPRLSSAPLSPADAAPLEDRYRITLDPGVLEKINRYLTVLSKWNRSIPLVGRLSPLELLERGFFEAFWAAGCLEVGARAVDVGSGAGFPGLAMKLHRPDLEMTLIDCNLKKVVFLREAARAMDLEAEARCMTGEDFPWDGGRIALMRALKPPPPLLERLRETGTRLLLLHGSETAPGLDRFRVLDSRPQPGSRARRLTLYAPGDPFRTLPGRRGDATI